MAYERRSFAGAGVGTTLDGGIDGSTLSIAILDATGWPSGSGGPFAAVIDRGLATEEKVKVESRSSLALTVAAGGRGHDSTAAVAHTSGATIELCLTAVDLDEANAHIADTALDHHTQYLNTTRHDVEARHTFGAALGTPATPASVGSANAVGTGDNPAREDHVHTIGAGIVTAAMHNAEAWTDWVPSYGNITVGDGTVVAKSMKRGIDVHFEWSLVFGSTTAIDSVATFTLPYESAGYAAFSVTAFESFTGAIHGGIGCATGGVYSELAVLSAEASDVSPFTWNAGDVLIVSGTYRATA